MTASAAPVSNLERLSAPARPSDAEALAALDARGSPSPWSAGQFLAEIEKPWARFWVRREAGAVGAFLVYWLVAGEAQLANVAVAPENRRRGWGADLLGAALLDAAREGARRMTLEVREGNAAALALYGRAGFRETSRRANFYEGREAAVLMEKELGGAR